MELTESSPDYESSQAQQSKRKRKFLANVETKEEKLKRKEKRARIIVRNIPYKSTEESLAGHFMQFGTVKEVNVLKRPDGRLVGCAFIQFETVNQAAKAILKATNKEFLGRPLFADWAIGKDEYKKRENVTVKEEDIKTEDIAEDFEIKEEEKSIDEIEDEIKEEPVSDDRSESGSDNEEPSESVSDSDTKEDVKEKIKNKPGDKKIAFKSNDVVEGCTIFLKNVPFDATNDDVRKACLKFGPVYYALVNTDSVSGHSKGTAFVKYKNKDSADLCLRSGEEFQLMGSVLEPHVALSREEIKQRNDSSKSKEPVDSRNLYLAKEGLIMAGSKAADGVSASDMAKRHKLEQIKTQILKNLNRFVSKNRLSIHNVPYNYDNEKLRKLVEQHTGLKVHECRVMRENKPTTEFPQGKPKGFGFMSFSTHQDALTALRKLNNNPSVFNSVNRPIVAFSIEDRSVHNIKQKRLQKSRDHNPTYKAKLEKKLNMKKTKNKMKDEKGEVRKEIKKVTAVKRKRTDCAQNEGEMEDFVGVPAKPGTFVRMRSNKKIKEQSRAHAKKVSAVKKLEKKKKEKIMLMKEKREVGRTKPSKKKTEKDIFSNLVDKYKRLIDSAANDSSAPKPKKTKWYSE